MKVLVIGASRGIGLEFVRQYRAAGDTVTASCRNDAAAVALRQLGATPIRVDVADAASASGLAGQIEGGGFDVAVVAAGVNATRQPGLTTPGEADFDRVMRTNVLGPMRVIPQIVEALAPGGRVAVLSSRMGSIGTRTAAGSSLYRASKAAVNSIVKDASLAYAGRAVCIAFHPGWVKTDMGGAAADIDVAASVAGMRRVVAGLRDADNGGFFNYDGKTIAW